MRQFLRVFLTCAVVGIAAYAESATALVVGLAGMAIYWQLHAIEKRLSELLRHPRINGSEEYLDTE